MNHLSPAKKFCIGDKHWLFQLKQIYQLLLWTCLRDWCVIRTTDSVGMACKKFCNMNFSARLIGSKWELKRLLTALNSKLKSTVQDSTNSRSRSPSTHQRKNDPRKYAKTLILSATLTKKTLKNKNKSWSMLWKKPWILILTSNKTWSLKKPHPGKCLKSKLINKCNNPKNRSLHTNPNRRHQTCVTKKLPPDYSQFNRQCKSSLIRLCLRTRLRTQLWGISHSRTPALKCIWKQVSHATQSKAKTRWWVALKSNSIHRSSTCYYSLANQRFNKCQALAKLNCRVKVDRPPNSKPSN